MHKWSYLASRDMHDKVHRREIAREWESILDELEDGKTHRPDVRADAVFPSRDTFGLPVGGNSKERNERANRARFRVNISRTAMYLVVPVKVPAHEPMSSPETPKSQSLTTPCRDRRIFEGLISLWMTFLECKYARPCKT